MGKPAARVGDMHVCPMVTPGVPPIPHVGGPITTPGAPTVMIGGVPAATLGSMCTCVGPPDSIILGSMGVMLGGKPAARMGDMTAHGGSIVVGLPTVMIGEISPSALAPAIALAATIPAVAVVIQNMVALLPPAAKAIVAQVDTLVVAAMSGVPFCEKCAEAAINS